MNKKLKKSRIVVFLILLIIILISSYIYIHSMREIREQNSLLNSTLKVNEIEKLIEENINNTNYCDYISVLMDESYIMYNATTEEKKEDYELCNLNYKFEIRNISDKNIEVKYIAYIPKELAERMIVSSNYIENLNDDIILKPGQAVIQDTGSLMIHYDRLDDEQKKIYEEFKNILYLQVLVNDQEFFIKLNANSN